MSETSFDIEGVVPAEVNFINEEGSKEEQPSDGTLAQESGAGQPAPEQPAPVQAAPVESDENYKNLQAAFTRATQENSDLRNRLSGLEARLAQPAPNHQNSFDVPAQQPEAPDELDKSLEDYEELKPFASRIKKLEARLASQGEEVQQSRADLRESQERSARQAHYQKISAAHPDVQTISSTPDFQGWVARQPSYVQAAISNGSAEEVIDVVSAYKASTSQPQQSPVDAARQIANPNVGSAVIKTQDSNKPTFSGAQIAAMSYADFIRLEPEIMLAQQEGRVTP